MVPTWRRRGVQVSLTAGAPVNLIPFILPLWLKKLRFMQPAFWYMDTLKMKIVKKMLRTYAIWHFVEKIIEKKRDVVGRKKWFPSTITRGAARRTFTFFFMIARGPSFDGNPPTNPARIEWFLLGAAFLLFQFKGLDTLRAPKSQSVAHSKRTCGVAFCVSLVFFWFMDPGGNWKGSSNLHVHTCKQNCIMSLWDSFDENVSSLVTFIKNIETRGIREQWTTPARGVREINVIYIYKYKYMYVFIFTGTNNGKPY